MPACRCCLSDIIDTNFIALNEDNRQSLRFRKYMDLVLHEIDIDQVSDPVLCKSCSIHLQKAVSFKRRCFVSQVKIFKHLASIGADVLNLSETANIVRNIQLPSRTETNTNIVADNVVLIKTEEPDILISETFEPLPTEVLLIKEEIFEDTTKKSKPTRNSKILKNKKRKYYTCHSCEYVTRTKSFIKQHVRTHAKPFKCDDCDFKYKRKTELNAHMKYNHSSVDKPYSCDHENCPFRTDNEFGLSVHKRVHDEDRCYGCRHCGGYCKQSCFYYDRD